MVEIQYSKFFLIVGVLDISCQYFGNCNEGKLLVWMVALFKLKCFQNSNIYVQIFQNNMVLSICNILYSYISSL